MVWSTFQLIFSFLLHANTPFSHGMSRSLSTFSRRSKWLLTIVWLKHWARLGSSPEGFPSLILGCRLRKWVTHILPGLTWLPMSILTSFRIPYLLTGSHSLLSWWSHSMRTFSCMWLSVCWLLWASFASLCFPLTWWCAVQESKQCRALNKNKIYYGAIRCDCNTRLLQWLILWVLLIKGTFQCELEMNRLVIL